MAEQVDSFYGLPILNDLEISYLVFNDIAKLKNKIESYSVKPNLSLLIDIIVDNSIDCDLDEFDSKTKLFTKETAIVFGVKTVHYLMTDINNSRQKNLKENLNPVLDFLNNDQGQELLFSIVNYPKIQEENQQKLIDFKKYYLDYNQKLIEKIEKIGYSKYHQKDLQDAFYVGVLNYLSMLIDLYVDYNFYQIINEAN